MTRKGKRGGEVGERRGGVGQGEQGGLVKAKVNAPLLTPQGWGLP